MRYQLSDGARQKVEEHIDRLFDRLLGRFVGIGPKSIGFEITHDPVLSLPGVFASAAVEGGTSEPDKGVLSSLLRITANYLNGIRERAKAQILYELENAVTRTGAENMADVMKELEGHLADQWTKITADVKRVLETETAHASNQGLFDGITKVGNSMGIHDPVVFKVVVKDDLLCEVCKKVWIWDDGITPRLYRMSELQHGYMDDRHEPFPTVGGSHPHCRCTLTTLMPGFGFDAAGLVAWVAPDHDELAKQRS